MSVVIARVGGIYGPMYQTLNNPSPACATPLPTAPPLSTDEAYPSPTMVVATAT